MYHMSYGQYFWLSQKACILCKGSSRAQNIVPIYVYIYRERENPMSSLNLAGLSAILTIGQKSGSAD